LKNQYLNKKGLQWAKQSSDNIYKEFKAISQKRFDNIPDWKTPDYSYEFDPLLFKQDWKIIQLTMWNYAGIVRNKRGLDRAHTDLNYHSYRILKFYKEAKLNKQIIELRNGIVNAFIVVKAAMRNTQSIGCHYIEN